MQKGQGTSAQSSKISATPLSKPATPYNLIMSLEELQIPVFQIVKNIIRPTPVPMQEENVIRNKRPSKNQARSTASLTLSVVSPERSARKEMSLCKKENYRSQASKEYRRYKEKQQFSKKVNKIFHKKYSYQVDEGENIDRLNAKLDKYIMRYLVGQKSTLSYQQ